MKSIITSGNAIIAADLLEEMNKVTNAGRGSSVAFSVIRSLRLLDIEGAHLEASLDFDKVRQYAEMAELFQALGLTDEH